MDDKKKLIERFNNGEFKTGLKDSSKETSIVVLLEQDEYVFGYSGVREIVFFRQKIHQRGVNTSRRFTIGITGHDLKQFTKEVEVNLPILAGKAGELEAMKRKQWVRGTNLPLKESRHFTKA